MHPTGHDVRERVLAGDPAVAPEFCKTWLQLVSRTFALNIRVLPPRLEEVVRLAYLFMRIADTVEDDRAMPPERRKELLEQFVKCFDAGGGSEEEIEAFIWALPAEWRTDSHPDRFLVAHADLVFAVYRGVAPELRKPVDERVAEMCGGMVHYAMRRESDGWFRLSTRQELLDYCYFVAGTVGLMLTDHFCPPGSSPHRREKLRANAVGFGLALQLVNIARDIPADGIRQTVFVPEELCRVHGIEPSDMWLAPHREAAARVLKDLVRMADREIRRAQEYVLDLPWTAVRLRLFCLWPLLMAQDTLILLASDPEAALEPGAKIKIGRPRVRGILWKTTLTCWSNLLLRFQFSRRNRATQRILQESSS